ncbi:MAG: hypothetical protein ABI612_13885 [Betaproteobacteria bacterium]
MQANRLRADAADDMQLLDALIVIRLGYSSGSIQPDSEAKTDFVEKILGELF